MLETKMFTEEQNQKLAEKLNKAHVAQRKGGGGVSLSYLEGWHVINEANRIFGFDGWDRETVELKQVGEFYENQRGNTCCDFIARVRIIVNGHIIREGTGYGSGVSRNRGDAIELAAKEAETDAMKRALMTFGHQFGLALYDKQQRNVSDEALLSEDDGKTIEAMKATLATLDTRDQIESYKESVRPEYNVLPAIGKLQMRQMFEEAIENAIG